jgi:hypothetical protein
MGSLAMGGVAPNIRGVSKFKGGDRLTVSISSRPPSHPWTRRAADLMKFRRVKRMQDVKRGCTLQSNTPYI